MTSANRIKHLFFYGTKQIQNPTPGSPSTLNFEIVSSLNGFVYC